jgi:hypothetical protein
MVALNSATLRNLSRRTELLLKSARFQTTFKAIAAFASPSSHPPTDALFYVEFHPIKRPRRPHARS